VDERFEPIVATGATIVFVGMALFAFVVCTTNIKQPENPIGKTAGDPLQR
jgi:hypothetical protein